MYRDRRGSSGQATFLRGVWVVVESWGVMKAETVCNAHGEEGEGLLFIVLAEI